MAIEQAIAGLSLARQHITGAIQKAASATGASFEYMLAAAKIESNLNPVAAAPTSSARGLYQFIEQTWLATVKEGGASFGMARYANAISRTESGRYVVEDPSMRREILQLRDNPAANAAMAGVLTQVNGARLAEAIGRPPNDHELYIAHFLGVAGAGKLINAARSNPSGSAAAMFPAAAAANRSIFYDRSGQARSSAEVYGVLSKRYIAAAASPVTQAVLASAGSSPSAQAKAGSPLMLTAFNAQDNPPPALAGGDRGYTVRVDFRTLFHAGDRSEPVSAAVHNLWANNDPRSGAPSSSTGASAETPQAARPAAAGFELFSDRAGVFAS